MAERTAGTDPKSYSLRDLLLVSQILHTSGLIQPEQVLSADLGPIAQQWFTHNGTTLSRNQQQFPTEKSLSAAELSKLYENMLEDYGQCRNTTDLANTFYFARIAELEQKIELEKKEFRETLAHLER